MYLLKGFAHYCYGIVGRFVGEMGMCRRVGVVQVMGRKGSKLLVMGIQSDLSEMK